MLILAQCRPGFETEIASEWTAKIAQAKGNCQCQTSPEAGFALIDAKAPREFYGKLHWKDLIFSRQWWTVSAEQTLVGTDRVNPLVSIAKTLSAEQGSGPFSEIVFEKPDTNAGREVTGFLSRMEPLLVKALQEEHLLDEAGEGPRLMFFFASMTHVYAGVATERSAPWPMGFPRLRFPAEAPSRSTLKLAEAFEVLLTPREQDLYLRSGMHAVDLGAAPGGWTWQLVARGMMVEAIDNGPMKGGALGHPSVKHLKTDGFRYRPARAADWLVCDMVEQPSRVAELVLAWMKEDLAHHCMFNLKLPMKARFNEVQQCLALLRQGLEDAGIGARLLARHLYHDREEITVYLRKEGKSKKTAW